MVKMIKCDKSRAAMCPKIRCGLFLYKKS